MEAISTLVDEILHGKGYVLIPNVLSVDQAAEARSLVLKLADLERQTGKLFVHEQKERLYGLVYKGEIFEQMVQHPVILPFLEAVLGDDMLLGDFSAHILAPGAASMGTHVDYPYWAMKPPFPAKPVMMLQTIWMLEDFTETNGATLIAPGTQTSCLPPDLIQFAETAEKIIGKAGSIVISHGLCWHDTAPNLTSEPRVSILGNYNPKFIHPIQDPMRDVQQAVIDRATPKLKQLLGLEFQTSLFNNVKRIRTQGWD
ncbi:MAG: phytanoyl-CoA dioxygenase family protein [Tildeniella nuda ZEHNDER 1965/U140]|nr:phytanoyl-CoA dioxygenase family protein [Tildeniella nuda ZEHNDER 1965/U140]